MAINCISDAKAPLMEGSAISLINIGATKAYAHPLKPIETKKQTKIIIFDVFGDLYQNAI